MPRTERPRMADYGVPAELDGALPWAWAEERLVRCRNYWIVTASAKGRPHAMPAWGVWLPATERFWFACAPSARKLRNVEANPQVTIAVDDTIECVSLEGTARRADVTEAGPAIDAYLPKYWDDPEQHQASADFLRSNAIVEVTPRRAFGIIERDEEFSRAATRWVW